MMILAQMMLLLLRMMLLMLRMMLLPRMIVMTLLAFDGHRGVYLDRIQRVIVTRSSLAIRTAAVRIFIIVVGLFLHSASFSTSGRASLISLVRFSARIPFD